MNEEIIKNIFIIIGTWITAIITYKLTSKNEKSKILSTQFKQQGIDKQKKLLELWTICAHNGYEKFLDELKNEYGNLEKNDTELLKLFMNDIVLYTSKETMRYFAIFMQNAYKTNKGKTNKIMDTIYISFKIMSSMKYDFTGERVKCLDLIKIQINDLDIKRLIKLKFCEIKYGKMISHFKI